MKTRKKTPKQNEESIQLGREAKQILESPVLQSAMTMVEASALEMCRSARTPEEAFTGSLRAQAAQHVRKIIHAFVADGERAARELEESFKLRKSKIESEQAHVNYLNAAREARSESDHFATASREE